MSKKREKEATFFILDGHSLAYRAFFALPLDLATKQGVHTGAVLGFINMLLRLKKDESPDYLAVAFDYPSPTFRHKKYGEYKATREKTPPEMREQLPLIKDILHAFNIPSFEMEGYEADDLIGTFARQGEEAGLLTVIVTADADVYQLLSPMVKALITRKGITNLQEITSVRLFEDYGLTPEQWIDFKALKGDSSDNIPGVPGIGEKRALQLLSKYGSLDETLKKREEIKGKIGESLSENISQALLSRELVTIDRQVPITLPLRKCRLSKPDVKALYDIFTRLEFNNLLKKIPEFDEIGIQNLQEKPSEKQKKNQTGQISLLEKDCRKEMEHVGEAGGEVWKSGVGEDNGRAECEHIDDDPKVRILSDPDLLAAFLTRLGKESSFTVLLSMEKDASPPYESFYRGLVFFQKGEEPVYIPWGDTLQDERITGMFRDVFADPSRYLITHDWKILLKLFIKKGITVKCSVFDTLLAAYLLEADKPAYHLPVLLEEYLGKTIRLPEKKAAGKEREKQEIRSLMGCIRELPLLEEVLRHNLELRKLDNLFFHLELPLVPVLAKMELRGIKVEEKIFQELAAEMEASLRLLEKEITMMAGQTFNLNSPQQLSYILFEKLKLPALRKIKTGYSTDARVLQELAAIHPIASRIFEYRTVAKIKNTYLEGFYPFINKKTGRINTTFNQAVTATGRLSSKDPNLQNIPVKWESGRRLRRAFIPADKNNLFFAADYSQIELRIMAHLSQDPSLVHAFNSGEDIHMRTAAEVFGVSSEEVTPLMRSRAKAVNFGIIYGISDYGLSQDLQISRAEAREYINQYFQRYPGVKKYVEECITTAREKGYVTTVMNRRRYLPDINHTNFNRRSFAERMARNTPVQGSAADIIKAAMIAIDRELEKATYRASMLLQVHDELIFEVPPEKLEEVSLTVKELMEGIFPLSVPLKVDLKAGKDWYHLFPLEGG